MDCSVSYGKSSFLDVDIYHKQNINRPKAKKMEDVSPLFLVEASGDSEGDMELDIQEASISTSVVYEAEDDAESCSCDVSDGLRIEDFNTYSSQENVETTEDGYYPCGLNYMDEEKEDAAGESNEAVLWPNAVSTSRSRSTNMESTIRQRQHKKKKQKEDSDRLFWEACLAS